jgi:hypothetical protein
MVLGPRQLFKRQQTPVFLRVNSGFFMSEILPTIAGRKTNSARNSWANYGAASFFD